MSLYQKKHHMKACIFLRMKKGKLNRFQSEILVPTLQKEVQFPAFLQKKENFKKVRLSVVKENVDDVMAIVWGRGTGGTKY